MGGLAAKISAAEGRCREKTEALRGASLRGECMCHRVLRIADESAPAGRMPLFVSTRGADLGAGGVDW
ncbi:hypothetical protein SZ55_0793 [Pseudomonas sp. FeS53a]|nr:hypothetical protein SZ55_0793 [Pseudomonas sp. FeS53a]